MFKIISLTFRCRLSSTVTFDSGQSGCIVAINNVSISLLIKFTVMYLVTLCPSVLNIYTVVTVVFRLHTTSSSVKDSLN